MTRQPPPDYEDIDGAPLRESENRALRLLLEKERARERLARKLKWWLTIATLGLGAIAAGSQIGIVDMIAGALVRMKH